MESGAPDRRTTKLEIPNLDLGKKNRHIHLFENCQPSGTREIYYLGIGIGNGYLIEPNRTRI